VQIPKKTTQCTHTMHNTVECCKYNKDGTPTRDSFRQAVHKPHEDTNHKRSYAQMAAWMDKLEKSLKKANKKSKKHNCYDSSDSNSDSSWSVGSGSFGKISSTYKKCNFIQELNIYTTLDPNKPTTYVNFRLKSTLINDSNINHLYKISLKNLKRNSILSSETDEDTNSGLDISTKLD
jgi:hypothetical protein